MFLNKFFIFLLIISWQLGSSQSGKIIGIIQLEQSKAGFVNIRIPELCIGTVSEANGYYELKNIKPGNYKLVVSLIGYVTQEKNIEIMDSITLINDFYLLKSESTLNEVVISGTQKEISKLDSPIPVEVYTANYFKKNPTPNIFEALSIVNGVQPQLNCNVCNTGDIHINGMEGPYTMVLIDGMPIVSSLATVYGLSGIPNSMIKRIEVVKGSASTLYGSEAVGGLINIITKDAYSVPKFYTDLSATGLGEYNMDISTKGEKGKVSTLLALNGFWFDKVHDINNDNFTDITLQKRFSVFNKINFAYNDHRTVGIAFRYLLEDRWGGERNWTKQFRGGDSVYGESITTNRVEAIGKWELPFAKQNVTLDYSYNFHQQDSYYGTTKYYAQQHTGFTQLRWDKKLKQHDLLMGLPFRFINYDDNTPGTSKGESISQTNAPIQTILPGIFIQDEIQLKEKLTTLIGLRYDYHNEHGSIFTPRLSFKWQPNKLNTIRLSGGNGFRVVNLFTEDHAALTGARKVVITEELKPEQSWNGNLNFTTQYFHKKGFIEVDASLFYTYFTNKIVADYTTNAQEIIYNNLKGFAVSRGTTLNLDLNFTKGLKIKTGITIMDVFQKEKDTLGNLVRRTQQFAPMYSGTFVLSYTVPKIKLVCDLSSNWKGPMYLPVVPNDFRPEMSPWFALVNLQLSRKFKNELEVYGGAKNLLNFVPKNPIFRPEDPFDKKGGENNPNGFTFDPSYNFAPVQGIKIFIGVRWSFN